MEGIVKNRVSPLDTDESDFGFVLVKGFVNIDRMKLISEVMDPNIPHMNDLRRSRGDFFTGSVALAVAASNVHRIHSI